MSGSAEFLTYDLEEAKAYLLERGCKVVIWEGKGGRCYLKDRYGVVFNLFEESE